MLGGLIYVTRHSIVERIIPAIWVGLSGWALCVGLGMFWRPPLALAIDSEGIVTNYRRRPRDRIFWSEIKGAHFARVEDGMYGFMALYVYKWNWKIIALELVDPARFQALHDKRRYLGSSTGFIPAYFPIRLGRLDIDADKLLSILNEGIVRNGHLAPDPMPQTTYDQPTFL
jgi:hypothetical protein